jgi:hypothetical protein
MVVVLEMGIRREIHSTFGVPGCIRIWESWASLRVKLFSWLDVRRRHWIADQRRRYGLDMHNTCLLCDQETETIDYIMVTCSFSRQVWCGVRAALGETHQLLPSDSIVDWWDA